MDQVVNPVQQEKADLDQPKMSESQTSLLQKLGGPIAEIWTAVTCFRYSIASMIIITRG